MFGDSILMVTLSTDRTVHFRWITDSFFIPLSQEKSSLAPYLHRLSRCRIAVVAQENKSIVGIAGVDNENTFFVIVERSHQNRGIGQNLTRKVIYEAKAHGYGYVELGAESYNTKAIHIYKKYGFKVAHHLLIENTDCLRMVLPIDYRGLVYIIICKMNHALLKSFPCKGMFRRLAAKIKLLFGRGFWGAHSAH